MTLCGCYTLYSPLLKICCDFPILTYFYSLDPFSHRLGQFRPLFQLMVRELREELDMRGLPF